MLSRSTRALRLAPALSRSAVTAAGVKALAAEQKALSAALGDVGGELTPAKAMALIESDPALKATLDKVKADDLSWTWSMLESAPTKPPVTVAVVGAGSPVGSAALFRIAAGEMLGLDQPLTLQLTGADPAVQKELEAIGFPLLKGVTGGGKGAAYVLVLEGDGKAAASAAAPGALVAVSGMTAAAAAAKAAPGVSVTAISAPAAAGAAAALAKEAGVSPAAVENVISWGSGVADVSHATVAGKWALKATSSPPVVSSEASAEAAADAIVGTMKAWATGSDGKWVSMGVPAVGDYGMGTGFYYSVPVTCTPGEYKRVGGITLSPAVAEAMEAERTALLAEAKAAGL